MAGNAADESWGFGRFSVTFDVAAASTVLTSADLSWSNEQVHEAGGSEGVVNGFWGNEVPSVSTTVPVPGGATTAVLRLRYWAIDSWDGGETARVSVDGSAVWEMDRSDAHSCGEFTAYTGDANIPDPWNGDNHNHPHKPMQPTDF